MTAFADLSWDRKRGELTGRGHAMAMSAKTAPAFDLLWRQRGSSVDLTVIYGRIRAASIAGTLHQGLARFGLDVKGVRHHGYRLIDLVAEKETAA